MGETRRTAIRAILEAVKGNAVLVHCPEGRYPQNYAVVIAERDRLPLPVRENVRVIYHDDGILVGPRHA